MTSSSLMGRFSSSRNRSPILPLHRSSGRAQNEYDLEELKPRPDDHVFAVEELPPVTFRETSASPSFDAWTDKSSLPGSPSKSRSRPLFTGPPPPIAASAVLRKREPKRTTRSGEFGPRSPASSRPPGGVRSLLFDYKHEQQPSYRRDSVWRNIRGREKALEGEVQQLLDLQASGLIAGSNGPSVAGDADGYSDTGSSTPTGTFYSTATSKSRMVASLHVPTRSTPDGNVIPVRQPKRDRPRGLRSARSGLRRSLAAFAQLKAEEEAHVNEAIAHRTQALNHLSRLQKRRENISVELHSLEEDEEEPLGQELRQLDAKHESLNQEIRRLEEKLVGMRNQRRVVRSQMEDVRNRREAGLSGYRGALQEVDSETSSLMRRPPIEPLDLEAIMEGLPGAEESFGSAGGAEFLKMIPERRTADMAKTWWEGEMSLLEQRKSQVSMDRQALEEGGIVWEEVVSLVSGYESRLRKLMSGSQSPIPSTSSFKGKEKEATQEELLQHQMVEMDSVAKEVEKRMEIAEDKHWNLLICAIGAELEAFREAQELLRDALGDDGKADSEVPSQHPREIEVEVKESGDHDQHHEESSDNEVPADLLVSHAEDSLSVPAIAPSPSIIGTLRGETQGTDGDEVPPEFLVEHGDGP